MTNRTLLKTLLFLLGVSGMASAQIPGYVPSSGLVGWWPFTGNGNDLTSNANHATAYGAVLAPDRHGNSNSAYACNSGYLKSSTTTSIPHGGVMSIAAWIYPTSDFGLGEIICLGTASSSTYWGVVAGNNAFTLNYGRGCGSTGSSLQSIPNDYDQWHHLVMVSTGTGGTAKIYYDGVYVGTSTTASTGGTCSTANLYFGVNAFSSANYTGRLDDIGIWDRPLIDCEIWDLYTETVRSGHRAQPQSQTADQAGTVRFSAASASPGALYQWQTDTGAGFYNISNGGQYSGVTTPNLTVSGITEHNSNQQFRCLVTEVSNLARLTVNNAAASKEYTGGRLFSVNPNPFSDQLSIKADKGLVGSVYVLQDYTGKTILTGKIQGENTSVETSSLAPGIYLLSVGADAVNGIKVVKQ